MLRLRTAISQYLVKSKRKTVESVLRQMMNMQQFLSLMFARAQKTMMNMTMKIILQQIIFVVTISPLIFAGRRIYGAEYFVSKQRKIIMSIITLEVLQNILYIIT